MNANTNRIINVADPVDPGDVVNLSFLEAKDATDYAFKSIINDTGTGSTLTFDLSVFDFDQGGLISSNIITLTEDGVYIFIVKGSSSFSGSTANLFISINGVDIPVYQPNNFTFRDTFLFNLSAGETIQLKATNTLSSDIFSLEFFGYKL